MIPPFQDNGYLPPGLHEASLDEVEARFGLESEIRRAQMESIRWLVELAKSAKIVRLVINGSFVTDSYEPNDVDCVVLLGPDDLRDFDAEEELLAGLPFLQIDLVKQQEFDMMTGVIFASDRREVPKGLVEVSLWP